MSAGPSLLPWDPQPGEPGTSFAGFVVYRETPSTERSLRAVAVRLGRSPSLIERYSSRGSVRSQRVRQRRAGSRNFDR